MMQNSASKVASKAAVDYEAVDRARGEVVDRLVKAIPEVCNVLKGSTPGVTSESLFQIIMARLENTASASEAGFLSACFDADFEKLTVKFPRDKQVISLADKAVNGKALAPVLSDLKRHTESRQLGKDISSYQWQAAIDAFRAAVLLGYRTFDRNDGQVHEVTKIRSKMDPLQMLPLEMRTEIDKVEYCTPDESLLFTLRGKEERYKCPLYSQPGYDPCDSHPEFGPSGKMPIRLSDMSDDLLRVAARQCIEASLSNEFLAQALQCQMNYVRGRTETPPGVDGTRRAIERRFNDLLKPYGDPRVDGLKIAVDWCAEDQGTPYDRDSLLPNCCRVVLTSDGSRIQSVEVPLPTLTSSVVD